MWKGAALKVRDAILQSTEDALAHYLTTNYNYMENKETLQLVLDKIKRLHDQGVEVEYPEAIERTVNRIRIDRIEFREEGGDYTRWTPFVYIDHIGKPILSGEDAIAVRDEILQSTEDALAHYLTTD